MAYIAGIGSTATLAIGGALVVSVVVGVTVVRQIASTPPDVGATPAQISAPSVPATSVRKTIKTATSSADVNSPAKLVDPDTPAVSLASPTVSTDAASLGAAPLSGQKDIALGAGLDLPVTNQSNGGTVVASTDPDPEINVSTAPLEKPSIGKTGTTIAKTRKLWFDVVRVDIAGSTVVAGKAIPGQIVDILVDGKELAQATADARGGFVALFDLPEGGNPQVITLSSKSKDGSILRSSDRVLVMGKTVVEPVVTSKTADRITADRVTADRITAAQSGDTLTPPVKVEAAPAVIIASDAGIKVVQPLVMAKATPQISANVTIDLISYDSKGEVVLTGRSKPGQHVRVYVDGKPVKTQAVGSDGTWQLSLPEVDAGRYILRVDEINGDGQVTSRIETPFQKEFADSVKRVASNSDLGGGSGASGLPTVEKVTIQPGATLWALAEANYGQGNLYMQIFNANKDFIRDPDLIYPGQIFTIPK